MDSNEKLVLDATISEAGEVRLAHPIQLPKECRALVVVLQEEGLPEAALLSEPALAEDWKRPEEEQAWSFLNRAQ